MKVRRVLIAAAATMMLVAACDSGGSGSGSSKAKGGDLTWFMWSGSQQEVTAWQHVASLVTQKYPDIHVKFTTVAFADYFTKLRTEAASNTLPCIISLQSQRAAGFGSLFAPLTDYIKGFDTSSFDDTIMKGLTTGGSQRAIPYDYGPYLLFYNADMFRAAGAPLPKPGWTMDDFTAAMRKLSANGPKGLAAFSSADNWLPFAVDRGASYLKPDGTLDLTNSSLVDAFTWYSELSHKNHYAPQIPGAGDTTWAGTQFQAGSLAMVIDGPWDLINTKQTVKFTLGMAPLPSVSGTSTTLVAGSGFGIAPSCNDKADAWKAIQVLTGADAQQYLATEGRAFPARVAQQQYWYKNAVPGSKEALDASLKTAKPYDTSANWDRVNQLLTQYGVNALNGAQSPASVLKTVQSQAAN